MAAPSVGRRSRQRQSVAPYEGIENGGLDLFKAAVRVGQRRDYCLLDDGFFFCRRPAGSILFTADEPHQHQPG